MSTTTAPIGAEQETKRAAGSVAAVKVEPYLFFGGRCEEAVEFYRQALNAEVVAMMRFKDAPQSGGCGPANGVNGERIMHAGFRVGETLIMASDGCDDAKPKFEGFALSITAPSEEVATRRFAALAEGGQIIQPLSQTFFAKCFGMVTDRFGVMWMVIAQP